MASLEIPVQRTAPDPVTRVRTIVSTAQPWSVILTLVVSDIVALGVAAVASVECWHLFDNRFSPGSYLGLWPVLLVFAFAYAASNLYPAIGINAVEEFRRLSIVTSVVYCTLAAATFMVRTGEAYSRGIFLLSWALATALLPLSRAIFRRVASHHPAWGYPTVILGAGTTGCRIVERLLRSRHLGLRPVAILDEDERGVGVVEGVPIVGGFELSQRWAKEARVQYAVVVMPGASPLRIADVLERWGQTFSHLLVIPDLPETFTLWVSAKEVGGFLCLEVQQQLLQSVPRVCKRVVDLLFTIFSGIVVLPLIGMLALLVRLDSPGPVFYRHRRIGKDGRHFWVVKFRSMAHNPDAILAKHLATHPELRLQWETTQKLRDDPRITRIGCFLRKSSLDELPQVWNIIKGEMSWVGPRPIVDDEVLRYGNFFTQYSKVLPGITGLWQVSGRSDTTYAERVRLDCYYVQNWSVWLDMHILARTLPVVLGGRGAY